jgi:hypothetical protein
MLRHATAGWLIYFIEAGEIRPLGLFRSLKSATDDLEILRVQSEHDWQCCAVMFIGWGDVVFGSNETASMESIGPRQ